MKFLEIKHEYNCILKEIEGKVEDRAEKSELTYFKNQIEESLLEMKAIIGKKVSVFLFSARPKTSRRESSTWKTR